jgi:ABC-2 type transport system ATP-binding protein
VRSTEVSAALEGVVKRYGSNTALAGLDLKIDSGKVTALLGPNGAGKTTAISLLLGLATPDEGRALLFGGSPLALANRRRIGVMLQGPALPEMMRVRELVRQTARYYPRPKPLASVARLAGIEDLLDRRYGKLSGGQQRRVQFAMALCGDPELLFLDEPTSGLDIEAREALWSSVRTLVANGCAVLLTSHYIEEAEALADHVAVVVRGRMIAEGTVDQIRAQVVRQRVRCISAIPVEHVREWPGVTRVVRENLWLDIDTSVAEPTVLRLLQTDPRADALEVRRAGLAEAFVHITKQATQ